MSKLICSTISTPLGDMIAIADSNALHLLEFTERKNLAANIKRFEREMGAMIIDKTALALRSDSLNRVSKGRCFASCAQILRDAACSCSSGRAHNLNYNPILNSIQQELARYFAGTLTRFTTPISLQGTPFQKSVWTALCSIPYGQTNAYATVALAIQKPMGYRAVARANSTNKLALIVPCHRVINTDGGLGGYAGGLERKAWLLEHERSFKRP